MARSRIRLIRQAQSTECGLACIAMIAAFYGKELSLRTLRERHPVSIRGATLSSLITTSRMLGLLPRAIRVEPDALKHVTLPCILHWRLTHFVVLSKISGRRYEIFDPASGMQSLSAEEFSQAFSGVALTLEPTLEFKPETARERVRFSNLWSGLQGTTGFVWQVFAYSLGYQLSLIGAPMFIQYVADAGSSYSDSLAILSVAACFVGLLMFGICSELARRLLVLSVSQRMSFQITSNLVNRLFGLPVNYFESRHLGDVMSRIGSVIPVRNFLTNALPQLSLDVLTITVLLVVVYFYGVPYFLIMSLSTGMYLVVLAISYHHLKRRQEATLVSHAREQSNLMESIRAHKLIRLAGIASQRQAHWSSLYAEFVQHSLEEGSLSAWFDFVRRLLFGLQGILIVLVGALLIQSGSGATVGSLFAVAAYSMTILACAERIAGNYMEYRTADLHLERLSDIVFQDYKAPPQFLESAEPVGPHAIELNGLNFCYAGDDAPVLENLHLTISPGEMVAVVGPSGCGKSTLIRLLLGLYAPQSGTIQIDGTPLASYGLARWLSEIGVVMQDDDLLAGSILDNISLFSHNPDMERVLEACSKAQILKDIERFPMKLNTLVGDMGASLSGGQKQRILLARALYRNPRTLILDEGTSNIDLDTEQRIGKVIQNLEATRIVVAHRADLIERADRVVDISGAGTTRSNFSKTLFVHSNTGD